MTDAGEGCPVAVMSAAGPGAPWGPALFSLLHPAQVATVEAFAWIGEPLSAKDLSRIFDAAWPRQTISYHLRTLAAAGVLEPIEPDPFTSDTRERFYRVAP